MSSNPTKYTPACCGKCCPIFPDYPLCRNKMCFCHIQPCTTVPEREEKMTSAKRGVNIEPYLRAELAKGNIDFSIRARVGTDGRVYLYIHPTGKGGETMDYEASDDQLFLRY